MLTNRVIVLCLGLSSAGTFAARADHRHECGRIAGLAAEIQEHGRDLLAEFRVTYCSTPQYGALQAGARQLTARAGRLHALAHAGANPVVLRSALDAVSHSHRHLTQTIRLADLSFGAGYPGQSWLYRRVPSRNPEVPRLMNCVDQLVCQIYDKVGHSARHHTEPIGRGSPIRGEPNGLTVSAGRIPLHFGR
jgi:hypothetical protein